MHWTESTTFHDSLVASEKIFSGVRNLGQDVNQAMCAIGQVLPFSRIAHKIQSGIAVPE